MALPTGPGRPPSPSLDDRLDRWVRAGLIDAGQGTRIREFEADSAVPTVFSTSTPRPGMYATTRPSGTELLAYLGVLVALAGVVTLVYASGASLAVIAALTLVIGLVAMGATWEFLQRTGSASARAAGACGALGAVAIGTAAGEFATALTLFTRTSVTQFGCAPGQPCEVFRSTDQSGNVLLGACVAVVIALALLRLVPGRLAAIAAVVGIYVGAVAGINVGHLTAERSPFSIALVLLGASALLVGSAETVHTRQPDVASFLGFVGVVGATIPLYLVGGRSDVHLDVLAGLTAVIALAAGVAFSRPGIALGAVVGLAGLVVDVGARNFHTATALGVFFSVTGVAAVVALIATTRSLKNRELARHDRQGQ